MIMRIGLVIQHSSPYQTELIDTSTLVALCCYLECIEQIRQSHLRWHEQTAQIVVEGFVAAEAVAKAALFIDSVDCLQQDVALSSSQISTIFSPNG